MYTSTYEVDILLHRYNAERNKIFHQEKRKTYTAREKKQQELCSRSNAATLVSPWVLHEILGICV
jgi:hypothetical protein